MGKWIRTGECSNCGTCCLTVGMQHMLSPTSRKCKYIYIEEGIFCEIRHAVETGDVEFLEMIPEKDFDYWKSECEPYPDPNERSHIPPIHKLPDKCTCILTWSEDNGKPE